MVLFHQTGRRNTLVHHKVGNKKDARDYVVDTLKEKNRILNALRAREAELLQSSSEW